MPVSALTMEPQETAQGPSSDTSALSSPKAPPLSRRRRGPGPVDTAPREMQELPASTLPVMPDPVVKKGTQPYPPVLGLRKWEGRIIEMWEDTFTAELVPLDHKGPTLLADFSLNLLAPDDASARTGDMFYLTVRTIPARFGRVSTTSALRLRRLGSVPSDELGKLRDEARREVEAFKHYVE